LEQEVLGQDLVFLNLDQILHLDQPFLYLQQVEEQKLTLLEMVLLEDQDQELFHHLEDQLQVEQETQEVTHPQKEILVEVQQHTAAVEVVDLEEQEL
jgi:hypothetical protein